MSAPAYCPFYCEENIWHLAADPRVGDGARRVLVISNPERRVALWNQRAGSDDDDGLVVWDYHVVLLCQMRVWDLDTTLGLPSPASVYFPHTFRGAPAPFAPQFRVMDAAAYRRVFASDRRHMREPGGGFVREPPAWPPIGEGHVLEQLIDLAVPEPGVIVDLPGLVGLLKAAGE